MFTRAELAKMGFEVVNGQAVRVAAGRTTKRPCVVGAPGRRAVDASIRALQVEGWRGGDVLSLTLPFPPRTKKNSLEWLGKQSAAYRQFCARVVNAITLLGPRLRLPLPERAYNARVLFVCDNPLADAVGLFQGLADALETAGVVTSDNWIRSWNGSEVVYDRESPGLVVVLEPRELPPGAPVRRVDGEPVDPSPAVASATPSHGRSRRMSHARRRGKEP